MTAATLVTAFPASLVMVMTLDLLGSAALLGAFLAPLVAVPVALRRRIAVGRALVYGAVALVSTLPLMVPALFVAFFLALTVVPVVTVVAGGSYSP